MRRLAACAAVLVLTACGGASSGGSPAGSSTPKTAVSSSATSATSATSETSATPAPAAAEANPVDAKDLCAFLAKEGPELESVGSPVGALARFAGDFASWVEKHPDQKPRTSADLDDAASSCADARDRVTAALGSSTFAAVL